MTPTQTQTPGITVDTNHLLFLTDEEVTFLKRALTQKSEYLDRNMSFLSTITTSEGVKAILGADRQHCTSILGKLEP